MRAVFPGGLQESGHFLAQEWPSRGFFRSEGPLNALPGKAVLNSPYRFSSVCNPYAAVATAMMSAPGEMSST